MLRNDADDLTTKEGEELSHVDYVGRMRRVRDAGARKSRQVPSGETDGNFQSYPSLPLILSPVRL
jgi:hypothetical protein